LEVVNYNVEGQQYVCAGHVSFSPSPSNFALADLQKLRALWVMTQFLNQLSRDPHAAQLRIQELIQVVQKHVAASEGLSSPIKLERGSATIPLNGIDVPFHSTYLRNGIGSYRKFLSGKILEENIDPDKLIGKFIPNVTGKPFSVDRKYVEEVAEMTGSTTLRRVLETVSSGH
jgi:fatty acid synthase subunit beta